MKCTARAQANIAFVKYWGKRDAFLNLPAAGSLSLTLAGLSSTTTVTFSEGGEEDSLVLDGVPSTEGVLAKAKRVLDAVRELAGLKAPARVESHNDFPTGAGLASSASGLAALAVAAAGAAGLDLSPTRLSVLARLGSGSACRSLFGGYVEWCKGEAPDGSDSHGLPLHGPEHWDLRCIVAVVSARQKAVDSTRGMIATSERSPYHSAFLGEVPADLVEARRAIATCDLERLASVAERSCLRMHAAMMAADPPLIYLRPESWRVMERVRELRSRGTPAFFTADAGPNVKIFCEPQAAETLERSIRELEGVLQVIVARPGRGAEVLSGPAPHESR